METLSHLLQAVAPVWPVLGAVLGAGAGGHLTVRAVRRIVREEMNPIHVRLDALSLRVTKLETHQCQPQKLLSLPLK